MDFNKIYNRAKNIITKPVDEWQIIKTETDDKKEVVLNYALPLLYIIAILSLIGGLVKIFLLGNNLPQVFINALYEFVKYFVSMFFPAILINELASSFGSKKDINAAFKLVVYSFTAFYFSAILSELIPKLSDLFKIFGLYSIYLFWTGLTPIMGTPENKKLGYTVVSLLIIIVTFLTLIAIYNKWLLLRC